MDYSYRIAKYEVTNGQYAEFLNKVEPDGIDGALQLFNPQMETDGYRGGITYDAGAPTGRHYTPKPNFVAKPVVYVSYLDAMRFCNWLHNGQPVSGGTETGAYPLNGDLANGYETRTAGAPFFLPTEEEWYKAAYYDPTRTSTSPNYDPASGPGPYWFYPTRSDLMPVKLAPNSTNSNSANYDNAVAFLTDDGVYSIAQTHYGTFDQAGNISEMTETVISGPERLLRGDGWAGTGEMMRSSHSLPVPALTEADTVGFRVAAPVDVAISPVPLGHRVRILPLGDSITQGNEARLSCRYKLWTKLIDARVDFDFVGSIDYNDGGMRNYPRDFDRDHEGHTAYRSDQILSGLPAWMTYTPDIVLLHAGTNDAALGVSTSTTVGYLKAIIDTLRAKNPRVAVLLAKLIPLDPRLTSTGAILVVALNAQMDAIAVEKSTADSPVIIVDHFTGFDPVADNIDGVHPSLSGEEKMARRWFDALQLFITKPTVASDGNQHLTLSYRRLKAPAKATYTVQVSGDLRQWASGATATEEVSVVDKGDDTESVLARDLTSGGSRFIRLRLEYSP